MRSSRRSCIAAISEAKYSMHAPNRHEISNHKPTGNGGVCHRKNDSRVTAAKAEKFSITSTANTPPTAAFVKYDNKRSDGDGGRPWEDDPRPRPCSEHCVERRPRG